MKDGDVNSHYLMAVAVAAAMGTASTSYATPITYDFSATNFTSNRGSVAPVNFVSGSYTFDGSALLAFSLAIGSNNYSLSEVGAYIGSSSIMIGALSGGGYSSLSYTYASNDPIGYSYNDFFLDTYLPPFDILVAPTFEYTVATIGDLFKATTVAVIARNPSAVPVPAAAWLFGSGLVGLTGLARRFKTVRQ